MHRKNIAKGLEIDIILPLIQIESNTINEK